ncbi:hypothetical protein HK405_014465, partial [Cladochytrium tenue]
MADPPNDGTSSGGGGVLRATALAVFPRAGDATSCRYDPQRAHVSVVEHDASIVRIPVPLPGAATTTSTTTTAGAGVDGGYADGMDQQTAAGAPTTFSLEPRGYVRAAKFSEDSRFLGVMRSAKSLEFFGLVPGLSELVLVTEVVRDAKSSDAILGFEWTYGTELIMLCNNSFDFYQ